MWWIELDKVFLQCGHPVNYFKCSDVQIIHRTFSTFSCIFVINSIWWLLHKWSNRSRTRCCIIIWHVPRDNYHAIQLRRLGKLSSDYNDCMYTRSSPGRKNFNLWAEPHTRINRVPRYIFSLIICMELWL